MQTTWVFYKIWAQNPRGVVYTEGSLVSALQYIKLKLIMLEVEEKFKVL